MNNEYCYAVAKDKLLIKISLKAGDVNAVYLHYMDKYRYSHNKTTHKKLKMTKVASDGLLDYYEAVINVHMLCVRYYFEFRSSNSANNSNIHDFYGNNRFFNKEITDIAYMYDCPQPVKEEEMYIIPEWAKGAVVYEIFPDRFCPSDESKLNKTWYKTPMSHKGMLGGTLKGITSKIDYLKDLGIDVIYMTPIFKSHSNHKYDTLDYFDIDPDFGTKDDLRELIDTSHSHGMRVILDGVFNHTSPDFFAFKDVIANGEHSRYKDWYFIESFPVKTTGTPNFLTFAYYGGMPKLNCANKEVRDYIFNVVTYWINEFNIDGWRLDAADEVGHDFWKQLRKVVKSTKEDALLTGEIWHFTSSYISGDEWDTIMNYNFRAAVADYIATHSISATDFVHEFEYTRGVSHAKTHQVLWNLIDSHDTGRFLCCASEEKRALKLAAAIQMITPGMPMIYYGDEVGMTGGGDPDCRRGMLWDKNKQDLDMLNWYKKLIKIRKSHPCITDGGRTYLSIDNLIIFKAFNDDEELYIILHNGEGTVQVSSLKGKTNLITDTSFDGNVDEYSLYILK